MKRIALAAAAVLLFADGVLAQTSGLNRLTQRHELLGWEAVGRVDLNGHGFCTGALIASDLVLTAAHCVFDKSGRRIPVERIHFRAGLRDGVSVADRRVDRVAAYPGYNPKSGITPNNVRADVALLRLAQPIRTADAAPFRLHDGSRLGHDAVSVVSYGRGRAEALSRQRECRILDQSRALFAFDCSVTFGSSGAPVFSRTGSDRGRIVSVISGMGDQDGKQVAYGMALPRIVAELKAQLNKGPVRPSPEAKRITVGGGARISQGGAKFVRP